MTADGEGAVLFQTACNKRSLTLELSKPGSRGRSFSASWATADVVVANLPPASLDALGLDYATLRAIRPDIILATQTAFGDAGPYRERGGFDGVGQAMSGAMYITGVPGAAREGGRALRRLHDRRARRLRRACRPHSPQRRPARARR